MFTSKTISAKCRLITGISVAGAMILLMSACDATSETVTATVSRAGTATVESASADTSQQGAQAETPTVEAAAAESGEATEPPSQTQTPPPTTRATSTPRPTATTTNTPTPAPTAVPTRPLPQGTMPAQAGDMQQMAKQYPQLASVLNNPAVAMPFKQLMVAYQQGGMPAALKIAQQSGLMSSDGSMIMSTLTVSTSDTAATVAGLKAMGIQVLGVQGSQINIAVPIAQLLSSAQQPGALLAQMMTVPNVTSVMPPVR